MSFAPFIKPYSDECGLALADFLSTAVDVLGNLPRSLTVTPVSGDLKPMAVTSIPFRVYSNPAHMYSEGLRVLDKILGLIQPSLIRRGIRAVLLQYGGFFSVLETVITKGPDNLQAVLQAPHSFTALGGAEALRGVGSREEPTMVQNIDPGQKTKLLNLWRYSTPKKIGHPSLPGTPWVLLPTVLQALSSLVDVEDKAEDGKVFTMPGNPLSSSNGQYILRSNGIHWVVGRVKDSGSGSPSSFRAEVGYGSDFHKFLTSNGITRLAVDCTVEHRSVFFTALSEVSAMMGRSETCFSLNLPVIALHKSDNWWDSLTTTLNSAVGALSIQTAQP